MDDWLEGRIHANFPDAQAALHVFSTGSVLHYIDLRLSLNPHDVARVQDVVSPAIALFPTDDPLLLGRHGGVSYASNLGGIVSHRLFNAGSVPATARDLAAFSGFLRLAQGR